MLPEGATYLGTGHILEDGTLTNVPTGWDTSKNFVGMPSSGPEKTQVTPAKQRHTRGIPNKVVAICGHTIDTASFPTTNCRDCWFHFFAVNYEMSRVNMIVLYEGRALEVTAVHGKKYTKFLAKFYERVIELAEQAKETEAHVQENCVQGGACS